MEWVKEGEYGPCTLYENRIMKLIEIILSRGERVEGE
jgi:hypothetical protein